MISDKSIKKFQEAVKKDYGDDLSIEYAGVILSGIVNYFDLLAKLYHRIKTEDK